jgi:hypothetical protein
VEEEVAAEEVVAAAVVVDVGADVADRNSFLLKYSGDLFVHPKRFYLIGRALCLGEVHRSCGDAATSPLT